MSDRKPVERGEPRLPSALAILAVGVLFLLVPSDFRLSDAATFIYPLLLLVLLTLLVIGDPGRIDREVPWLRIVTTRSHGTSRSMRPGSPITSRVSRISSSTG